MASQLSFHKGPPCGIDGCRSTLFYEDNGHQVCKFGHQHEGVATQQDEDELSKKRNTTRKKTERRESISQIQHGHSARELYIQAYQLILWKQCWALIHTIGLSKEIEIVVHDLWALRLQLLASKLGAISEDDTVFSSQAQSEAETEDGGRKKSKGLAKPMPTLIQTLGLLYLGMILLRLPISMGEVHRWALREDIPYVRAIRLVPPAMKQKLPAEYIMALDTTSLLELDNLRTAIHSLCLLYNHHFGLVPPPLNAPLLLFKHIKDLALPLVIIPAFRTTADLLLVDFAFPLPGHRPNVSSMPEVMLLSILIVAVKLYYPFDDMARSVTSLSDPAILTIDWKAWVEAHRKHEIRLRDKDRLPRGTEATISEADVMTMSGKRLDDYLDWYERTWIDDERAGEKPRGLPKQLLDMFPTGRPAGDTPEPYSHAEEEDKERQSLEQMSAEVIANLQIRDVVQETAEDDSEIDTHRVGSYYKRYRRLNDLTPNAKVFYQAVATRAGISLETLVSGVLQVERKLMIWRASQLKTAT